jgi:hypothetical protein
MNYGSNGKRACGDRELAHWGDMGQMGRVRGAGGKKEVSLQSQVRSVGGGGGRVATTAAATNDGARRSAQVGAGSTTETFQSERTLAASEGGGGFVAESGKIEAAVQLGR